MVLTAETYNPVFWGCGILFPSVDFYSFFGNG